MCGIIGWIGYDFRQETLDLFNEMRDSLSHRGPDGYGTMVIDNVLLGHRRLSIIDLSDAAKQPMSCANNRYTITYNGEIYNFLEIKEQLKSIGYNFSSRSDTEVILYAYQEYGLKCLDKFNGMFAFAIWDDQKKELFLARDRFGQKPLYYTNYNGSFYFASELKAFKVNKRINLDISYESINCYLTLGYILNPNTQYTNVFQLEPAHYMKVDKDGNMIEKKCYWDYSEKFEKKTNKSTQEISNELRERLLVATKRRLISDVPVGAFLSGGIDSTSIVSNMKKSFTNELHTFSVGFSQNSYNELADADKAADWIGTIHHGFILGEEGNLDYILEKVNIFDELFCDNSMVPMAEVSKLASTMVKVVLSGDAADEMFAGYITYKADKFYQYVNITVPYFIRKILGKDRAINSNIKIGTKYKMQQFFNGTLYDYKKAHYLWRIFFRPEQRIKILGEKFRELVYDTDPYYSFDKHYKKVNHLDKYDQHLYVDAMTWLTDDILVKVDRTSMYSSIEARAPYLDPELVSYAATIPFELKLKRLQSKYILKRSLNETVPEFVLKKKKSGFNAPMYSWIPQEYNNEFQDFNLFVYRNFIKNHV